MPDQVGRVSFKRLPSVDKAEALPSRVGRGRSGGSRQHIRMEVAGIPLDGTLWHTCSCGELQGERGCSPPGQTEIMWFSQGMETLGTETEFLALPLYLRFLSLSFHDFKMGVIILTLSLLYIKYQSVDLAT